MILKLIPSTIVDHIVIHQLPQPDMVVDPRPIFHIHEEKDYKFEVAVNGGTVTRINRKENESPGWDVGIKFRVYSRNEFHYSLESTIYVYHGIKYERAPRNATEIIIKNGIKTIRSRAFQYCFSLSKITMPNTVTTIGRGAFKE